MTRVKKILIVYALFSTLVFLFNIGGRYFNVLQQFLYFLTLPFALISVWQVINKFGSGNPQFKVFVIILLAIICAGTGGILEIGFRLLHWPELIISIAPFFYFSSYLLFLFGYILESITLHIDPKTRPGIFTAFLVVGLVLAVIIFKLKIPSIASNNDLVANIVNTGYVVCDLSLIVASLLILFIFVSYRGGLLGQSWLYIFTGHFLVLIGDLLLAIFSKPYYEGLMPYILINLIYIIANLLISAGFFSIADAIGQAQNQIRKHQVKSRAIG